MPVTKMQVAVVLDVQLREAWPPGRCLELEEVRAAAYDVLSRRDFSFGWRVADVRLMDAAEKREADGHGNDEEPRLRDITLETVRYPTALAGLTALEFHEAATRSSLTAHLDDDGMDMLLSRLDTWFRIRMAARRAE